MTKQNSLAKLSLTCIIHKHFYYNAELHVILARPQFLYFQNSSLFRKYKNLRLCKPNAHFCISLRKLMNNAG